MKRWRFILALLLPGVILVSLILSGDPLSREERAWLMQHGKIMVAAEDYPPLNFIDQDGNVQGIAIDYWRLLADKLEFEVEFYPSEFSQELEDLKSGRIDSLVGIFPLEERAEYFDFSRPYMNINTYIFARPQYAHLTGFKDLKGLKVGVVKGDSGQTLSEAQGLGPKTFGSYIDTVLALAKGDVDAIVMDELVVVYTQKKYKIEDKIVRIGQPVDHGKMVLPVKKGNKVLLGILNKGVAAISAQELREISIKWTR